MSRDLDHRIVGGRPPRTERASKEEEGVGGVEGRFDQGG